MRNKDCILFDIREAAIHLNQLADELEQGGDELLEQEDISVDFGHILVHMCRAWHLAVTLQDRDVQVDDSELESLELVIPKNWCLDFRIQ